MNKSDMKDFLVRHDMNHIQFAELIGVTPMAVDHWLRGRRKIPLMVFKICVLFDRFPAVIKEF